MARLKKIPLEEEDLTTERRMEEIARRLHDLLILLPKPDEVSPGAFATDLTSADSRATSTEGGSSRPSMSSPRCRA